MTRRPDTSPADGAAPQPTPAPAVFTLDEDLDFVVDCLRDYRDEPTREEELAELLVARLRDGRCGAIPPDGATCRGPMRGFEHRRSL